jgi:hypothetical protein
MLLVHKPDRRRRGFARPLRAHPRRPPPAPRGENVAFGLLTFTPVSYLYECLPSHFKTQTDRGGEKRWTMGCSVEDARAAKKPRGGLSASELHPETLYAGDTIIYYTMAMVFGDQRGKRVAKVLTIKGGADFPLSLDTGELITQTQFVKKLTDRTGKTIGDAVSKWRKLRTLTLVDGHVEGETRISMLNQALRDAVDASYAATRAGLDIARARMEAGSPASTPGPAATTQAEVTDENDPSFAVVTAMDAETRPTMRTDEAAHVGSAGSVCSSLGDAGAVGVNTATHSPGSSIADIGGVDL